MKIDRLIGIIIVLLQKDRVTAKELAERFEVSRRTIGRDIEDICKAGIPIVTTQGNNGGISILDNYKLDKTIFKKEEIQSIYAGLCALDSVSENRKYKKVIDKFILENDDCYQKSNILIDLSSYYRTNLSPKIHLIEDSIENCTKIKFFYHKRYGGHEVTVNPYLILFRWSNWYVLAYEEKSQMFKLYKLLRITDLISTEETFEVIEIPEDKLDIKSAYKDKLKAVILFDSSEEYRLIEEYGVDSYVKQEDGKLRFTFAYESVDYLISWVLSFGNHAELLEPDNVRTVIKDQLLSCYENIWRDEYVKVNDATVCKGKCRSSKIL